MALLPVEHLEQRHRGLTEVIAAYYAEAASVCLSRHHTPPASVVVRDGTALVEAEMMWTAPDLRTTDGWANRTDATEAGACACILAGIELARGLFAVRRADTGTGADYYIGPSGAGEQDLEDCLRLEISGVDRGDERDVRKRLLEKIRQAREGDSTLPAVAGVVGFEPRLIVFADVLEAE